MPPGPSHRGLHYLGIAPAEPGPGGAVQIDMTSLRFAPEFGGRVLEGRTAAQGHPTGTQSRGAAFGDRTMRREYTFGAWEGDTDDQSDTREDDIERLGGGVTILDDLGRSVLFGAWEGDTDDQSDTREDDIERLGGFGKKRKKAKLPKILPVKARQLLGDDLKGRIHGKPPKYVLYLPAPGPQKAAVVLDAAAGLLAKKGYKVKGALKGKPVGWIPGPVVPSPIGPVPSKLKVWKIPFTAAVAKAKAADLKKKAKVQAADAPPPGTRNHGALHVPRGRENEYDVAPPPKGSEGRVTSERSASGWDDGWAQPSGRDEWSNEDAWASSGDEEYAEEWVEDEPEGFDPEVDARYDEAVEMLEADAFGRRRRRRFAGSAREGVEHTNYPFQGCACR